MQTSHHPGPSIPDYEILRKIGGGAYGEVWMAQGVTGAYRAIKVVRREDFDDERSFEREFEGILKFEPISRDHPGLVNVLHVGRSKEDDTFYYYVMELGDDVRTRGNINPVEYEARTLRSDIKAASGKAQPVEPCVENGLRLAEALDHLHGRGLAHRDIKPANIIFVNGKAKLADIGLVADRGQRTFVGTEGFVPPEGPGSAQADVYSLGKVLYEVSTGKDRLQFPEVPDELHSDTDPKMWQQLNQVVCDVCQPQLSKRSITTASQMADALKCIQQGKKLKPSGGVRFSSVLLWCVLLGLIGYSGYLAWPYVNPNETRNKLVDNSPIIDGGSETDDDSSDVDNGDDPIEPIIKNCIVNFVVSPFEGVEVYSKDGEFLGDVSSINGNHHVGAVLEFTLSAPDYNDEKIELVVPDQEEWAVSITLKQDRPPIIGKPWWDSLDQRFVPRGNVHESSFVKASAWERYIEQVFEVEVGDVEMIDHKVGNKGVEKIVLTTKTSAANFSIWLTEQAFINGRLNEDQEVVPLIVRDYKSDQYTNKQKEEGLRPWRLRVQKIPYAQLVLTTLPKGAKVYLNDEFLGLSDVNNSKIRPGKKILRIEKDGYETLEKKIVLTDGGLFQQPLIELQKNNSLVRGRPWMNQLGMKFVPVNDLLMVSAWETRVKDYQVYIESVSESMPKPSINNKPDEPIVYVSYKDAVEFAEWLTKRDIKEGLIPEDAIYRIPTDHEWSIMVGLDEDEKKGIASKALGNEDVYPWTGGWEAREGDTLQPLVEGADPVGNFSDESRKKFNEELRKSYYKGYRDGHSGTSPVGIFKSNNLGVFDLAGNVSEWMQETYYDGRYQVYRGSNFQVFSNKKLLSAFRGYLPVGERSVAVGFRLVLEIPQ